MQEVAPRRTVRHYRLIPALLVPVLVSPCAHSEATRSVEPSPAVLRVENHHWLDVVVYVIRQDGRRTRVGQVTATAEAQFELPWRVLAPTGQIRLVADPVGSDESHLSDSIVVRPGQQVEWTLERRLETSSISVR